MLPKPAPSALRPPPARQRYSTQASECGGHGHSKAPATRPQPCLCLWVGAGSTPPPGPGCACPQPRPQRWDWAARSPRLPGACLPAWPILSLCWGETPQPPSSQTPGNLCSRPPWPGVRPAGVPTAVTQAQMGGCGTVEVPWGPLQGARAGRGPFRSTPVSAGAAAGLQPPGGSSIPRARGRSTWTGWEGLPGLHQGVGGTWTPRGRTGSCVAVP